MAAPIPRLPPVTSAVLRISSFIPSMVHGSLRQHRARRGICRQVAEDELDRTQHHLGQGRSFKERRRVPDSAIEDPAFAIALDPNQSVVLVRTDMPGAEVCLLCINADEDMQFVTRIGAVGQEMIKLIGVDKPFPPKSAVRGLPANCLVSGLLGSSIFKVAVSVL